MGMLNQVICTIITCYLCLSIGLIFTWPSCTYTIFESANTTLHRPMTETELALFGSLSSIGGLISTPIAGSTLDILGRKRLMLLCSVTQVISWALIAAFDRVEVVLTAVFMTGVGGAGFLVVPIFVTEICQDSIRGGMAAASMIFYAIGMLVSYVIGGTLSYKPIVYVCLSISVVGVATLTYVKETPLFFLKRGDEEAAAESLAFYRNLKPNSKAVQEELMVLKRSFDADIGQAEEVTTENEKLQPLQVAKETREKLSMFDFVKKSPSTRQAILVTLVLMTGSLFQGAVVVQVFAVPLFSQAVPNMSSTTCSVLLAVITVVSGIVAAYLTELAGRRPLMIYASIAAGLCCVVLGTQLHLHWAPHWVTAICLYSFTITYTLGGGTVPYVLVPEVFLPEVKSFMAMFVIEWAWLCNFIILFIYNPLVAAIDLGPVFYIFAAVCFLTALFSAIYLPETKGLSLEAIQKKLAKKTVAVGWRN